MGVDRTSEFHAAVSSISSRSSSKSPAESRRLLSTNYNVVNGHHPPTRGGHPSTTTTPKSEFSRMAAKIGHDINATGAKLQRLAQCTSPCLRLSVSPSFLACASNGDAKRVVAKRKTLFDDKSTQISELIFVIKQDIADLNNDISNLQAFVKQRRNMNSRGKGRKEVDEHSDNVVVLLQSKLANTSMGFKDVLEIRTQVWPTNTQFSGVNY